MYIVITKFTNFDTNEETNHFYAIIVTRKITKFLLSTQKRYIPMCVRGN